MSTLDEVLTEKDKVASNSKEIAADLKEILSSLKKVMENGEEIQPGDKRLFSMLLKNLRTKVQIEIFNKLLDNNPDYTSLSASLETKIKDFKQELEDISEKNNQRLYYSSSQERVLERLIKSLEDSKKDLDKQNVISASTHLLENYNVQEILDNCTSSLGLGYKDFNPYLDIDYTLKPSRKFIHKGSNVDFRIIEKIIGIIGEDEFVRNEIVKYHKFVKDYDKEKSILEDNEALLHLLKIVEPYIDKIINIYRNSLSLAEKEKEEKHLIREIKVNIPRRKRNLQGNIVTNLLNSGEIKKCDSLLYKYNCDLDKVSLDINSINRNNDELIREVVLDAKDLDDVEVIKDIISLKDYVAEASNCYSYELPSTYTEGPIDYEWIFGLFLGIIRGNKTFIDALNRIENLVNKCKEGLAKKEAKKVNAYEKLSAKAKEYADSDIYSAKYCVDIIDSESIFDKTPVICAFILHILGQSKKISFDDLLEVVNLAAEVDVAKIEEEYNNIINRQVKDIREISKSSIRDYERLYKSDDDLESMSKINGENVDTVGTYFDQNSESDELVSVSENNKEEQSSEPVFMRQKYLENRSDLGQDTDVLDSEPTIFEQEEYSPYTMPQMGKEAYAKRVEVVNQYLEEKFGYSRSSQYQNNEESDDKAILL